MDSRSKFRISCALLALIMALNALLFLVCIYVSPDSSRATFYGINVLIIVLLFGTLSIQSYGYTGKPDEKRRSTPFMYSVIGVMAGSTLIISAVMGFSRAPSINDPVIFLSCVFLLVTYVYIIIQRDHS